MYVHNFKTKSDLINKNFTFNYFFGGYSLRFPVAFWNGKPTLEGMITLFVEENRVLPKIKLDVVGANTQDYYAPFYISSPAHKDFIAKIKKNITKKMKELGMKKIPKQRR